MNVYIQNEEGEAECIGTYKGNREVVKRGNIVYVEPLPGKDVTGGYRKVLNISPELDSLAVSKHSVQI